MRAQLIIEAFVDALGDKTNLLVIRNDKEKNYIMKKSHKVIIHNQPWGQSVKGGVERNFSNMNVCQIGEFMHNEAGFSDLAYILYLNKRPDITQDFRIILMNLDNIRT